MGCPMSGDEKKDLESQIRGAEQDLYQLTRKATLKRYKKAVNDAIDRVNALPVTATNDEIVAAGTVAVPRPDNI